MDDDQIWSQLDLRTNNICEVLDKILDKEPDEEDLEKEDSGFEEGDVEEDDEEFDEKLGEAIRRMKSGEDVDFAELGLDESLKELVLEGAFDEDEDDSDVDNDGEEEGDGSIDSEDDNVEEEVALRDSSSDRGDGLGIQRSKIDVITHKSSIQNRKRTRPGHPELDDNFFDLNAFNSQTEQFEAKNASSGILDDEEQEDAEEEVDLFAPIDLQEAEEEDSENNANSMRRFPYSSVYLLTTVDLQCCTIMTFSNHLSSPNNLRSQQQCDFVMKSVSRRSKLKGRICRYRVCMVMVRKRRRKKKRKKKTLHGPVTVRRRTKMPIWGWRMRTMVTAQKILQIIRETQYLG